MNKRNLLIGVTVLIVLFFSLFRLLKSEPSKLYSAGGLKFMISLSPSTPRVGDLKIKIRPQEDVSAIYINYGMPAMGNMPAMYSKVKAEPKAEGFEAILSVSMLGTWDLALNIKTKDGKNKKANFKFSTGQKGLNYYPEDEPESMEMPQDVQVVKLNSKQIKLAQVSSRPLKKEKVFQKIRTVGIVAYDPDLQVAQQEYLSALSDPAVLSLAVKKLKLLGLSNYELEQIKKSGKADENLVLPAKRAWVYAHIYEYEIKAVKPGQKVFIKSLSYPEENFYGFIRSIAPVLDNKTRTSRLRIEVMNAENKFQPNMYVDVNLNIPLGNKLVIPKAALLGTGRQKIVYVDRGSGYYEKRTVVVGPLAEAKNELVYPIISGLSQGELVVVAANFLIDSQSELSGGMSGLYGSSAKEVKGHDQHNH